MEIIRNVSHLIKKQHFQLTTERGIAQLCKQWLDFEERVPNTRTPDGVLYRLANQAVRTLPLIIDPRSRYSQDESSQTFFEQEMRLLTVFGLSPLLEDPISSELLQFRQDTCLNWLRMHKELCQNTVENQSVIKVSDKKPGEIKVPHPEITYDILYVHGLIPARKINGVQTRLSAIEKVLAEIG